MLVHRRGDGEMRYRAQSRHVEGSVVGRSVFAHQSGTVQTEHHRQVQDCHVVNHVVVGTLCERAIDVAERDEPVLRHASREGDGVALGDTHVEGSIGHRLHHDVHRASRRHGWSNAHDLRILLGKLQQGVAENVLELRRLVAGVGDETLASLGVELARRMPDGGTLLGRLVALALGGVQVEELRTLHVLKLSQYAHNLLHVVPVERTEVTDVHALEDILLMAQRRLQGIVQSDDALASVLVEIALGVEPLRSTEAQFVVGLVGVEL